MIHSNKSISNDGYVRIIDNKINKELWITMGGDGGDGVCDDNLLIEFPRQKKKQKKRFYKRTKKT